MACQAVLLTPLAEAQQLEIVEGGLASLAVAPTASIANPPPPSDAGSEATELESYHSAEDEDDLDQQLQPPHQQQQATQQQQQQQPRGKQAAEVQSSGGIQPHPTRPLAPVPSRAALAASPDYPVLVTADSLPGVSIGGPGSPGALPVNNGRRAVFSLLSFPSFLFLSGEPHLGARQLTQAAWLLLLAGCTVHMARPGPCFSLPHQAGPSGP